MPIEDLSRSALDREAADPSSMPFWTQLVNRSELVGSDGDSIMPSIVIHALLCWTGFPVRFRVTAF